MSEEVNNDGHLRKYLLGELPEAEQQTLEERLMTEAELFDLLQVAEDELVDDSLLGALSASERGRFDGFFLSTPERRRKLSFAMALRRYVTAEGAAEAPAAEPKTVKPSPRISAGRSSVIGQATWWNRAFSSPYLRMAAAGVIVIGLGLGIWRVVFYQSEVAKGMEALARAYRAQRPVESRISGLDYAPLTNTRGGGRTAVDEVSLNRAERILLDEVAERPSPSAHHALGRLYLAEKNFEKAVTQLGIALNGDENNARVHSDLGAALLEKARARQIQNGSENILEEFSKSLEHLNRALELDASVVEALFNRALCHEYMMLPKQAEEDWKSYLQSDPNSNWADEAKKHLQLLEKAKQKVSKSREEMLQSFLRAYQFGDEDKAWEIVSHNKEALSVGLLYEQLVKTFLDSVMARRDNEASAMLQAMLYLGDLERRKTGDRYTNELADFYRSLPRSRLARLVEGHALVRSGKSFYIRAQCDQAIAAYGKAKEVFIQAGDEIDALLADYWLAYTYPEKAETQRSLLILERLARVCEERDFKWLRVRVFLKLSVVHFALNRHSNAIEACNKALAFADEIEDANAVFDALSYLVEYYRYVGNYRQSLNCIHRSLVAADRLSLASGPMWRHYSIIASALNSAGFYCAALDYQKEALEFVKDLDDPASSSVTYAHLGLMHGKMRNFDEAIKNAILSSEIAKSCPDKETRINRIAYSSLQKGHLYRQTGSFAAAIQSYSESIDLYNSLAFTPHVYQAHKGRLVCYIAQNENDLASKELQTTLKLAEGYRSKILEADNRNNFFDIEQSVYDLAISFELSTTHGSQRAFEYSEASRARSLLDLLTTKTDVQTTITGPDIAFRSVSRPLSVRNIQDRLSERAMILQYAVLKDRVAIWVITKEGFSAVEKAIAQEDLSQIVKDLADGIQNESGAADLPGRAKELFEILISPVAGLLDRSKDICIIPDKFLSYVPFGSLISSESNRYLIEDYRITYSASSSIFVLCSEEADRKNSVGAERLLSIGNPRFDRSAFPTLTDLPSARREAEEIAGLYSLSTCLTGGSARKSTIKNEMTRANVVHLAVHCVVDEEYPMRSKLVLAADAPASAGSDGSLESYELYKLRLLPARLVVLSACRTGADRYYRGEGMLSIARPFIVAGVPIIVCSLWPVDSESTAELMISFHKHRTTENISTNEALRRAQLEMLAGPDATFRRPFHWASFISFGGA